MLDVKVIISIEEIRNRLSPLFASKGLRLILLFGLLLREKRIICAICEICGSKLVYRSEASPR